MHTIGITDVELKFSLARCLPGKSNESALQYVAGAHEHLSFFGNQTFLMRTVIMSGMVLPDFSIDSVPPITFIFRPHFRKKSISRICDKCVLGGMFERSEFAESTLIESRKYGKLDFSSNASFH